ncbi:MAG: hypothetical protein ACE5GE_08025 [Phycisphaerae bacterium]
MSASAAIAKPRHYEHLRAALLAKAAHCNTCHTGNDGPGLNAYGQALADVGDAQPLADRIAKLEGKPTKDSSDGTRPKLDAQTDVDEDGVANWVEILAGTSPADADSTPDEQAVDRVYATVSCKTCHRALNLDGKRGLEGNPHNELGALLRKTFKLARGKPRPKNKEDRAEAAQQTPILARFMKIRSKKPKGVDASYWQQLRMLHHPTDESDLPDTEELEIFKAQAKAQKRRSTRDPTLGLNCKAHKLDGFLKDAKKLD